MVYRVAVSWRGKHYEAVRREGEEARPEPGPVWQVTRDGAPVTSFPATAEDDAEQVKRKTVEWLEGNESRPAADVGRQ